MSNRNSTIASKIGSQARKWLVTITDVRSSDAIADLISAVIGIYLCDILEGTKANSTLLYVGRRLAEYLQTSAYVIDLKANGTARLLLAHRILSLYDLPTGVIASLVQSTANSLLGRIGTPSLDDDDTPSLLLLHRLGLIPVLPQPKTLTQRDISKSILEVLLASKEALYQVYEQINAASLFGTTSISASYETLNHLKQALPPIVLQRLRIYDLDLGAKLLRSLVYLQSDCDEVIQSSLSFLEAQQCYDGAFGHFVLERISTYPSTQEKVQQLYLSTTITCLWTIAELRIQGFRLL